MKLPRQISGCELARLLHRHGYQIYRFDPDAVVILDVFAKKTPKTPKAVLEACGKRLREYDNA